eukprot:CAMPEP_0176007606 /NCGR_PEP_ID=MMETSP0120_2-20121206/3319_1 /TAXON_ID=160619 /ORGANISM="Kryptoperidinium foliaceum, Strain CCMP 1326" /LENGTH=596 /DNA_ID=CAMNT_0017340371 /DNA_START=353 /DNA_END=2143 /DNA_ORIENTATION=+
MDAFDLSPETHSNAGLLSDIHEAGNGQKPVFFRPSGNFLDEDQLYQHYDQMCQSATNESLNSSENQLLLNSSGNSILPSDQSEDRMPNWTPRLLFDSQDPPCNRMIPEDSEALFEFEEELQQIYDDGEKAESFLSRCGSPSVNQAKATSRVGTKVEGFEVAKPALTLSLACAESGPFCGSIEYVCPPPPGTSSPNTIEMTTGLPATTQDRALGIISPSPTHFNAVWQSGDSSNLLPEPSMGGLRPTMVTPSLQPTQNSVPASLLGGGRVLSFASSNLLAGDGLPAAGTRKSTIGSKKLSTKISATSKKTKGKKKKHEDAFIQREKLWSFFYDQLKDYKAEYGHCDVPKDVEGYHHGLFHWVRNQRQLYSKQLKKNASNSLTPQRKKMLDDLGFVWDNNHRKWMERYHELVAYQEKHGNCDVPARNNAHQSLSNWVRHQRRRYANGVLEENYIGLLEKVDFSWKSKVSAGRKFDSKLPWGDMYGELVAFKRKYGHCDLPARDPERQVLCYWVSNQRRKYARNLLASEQVELLNDIGFVWKWKPNFCRDTVASSFPNEKCHEENEDGDPSASSSDDCSNGGLGEGGHGEYSDEIGSCD